MQMKTRLTERDLAILEFISSFGFCEMPQIERRFGLKKPRSYQVLKRLVVADLINHQRIFCHRHGIFRLTSNGARQFKLPLLDKIIFSQYEHKMMITEVYLKLSEMYPTANWISERELQHEKFSRGVGQRGHLPDGILILPNDKKIVIEVELTLKSEKRITEIFRQFAKDFSIESVWYFSPENLVKKLEKFSEKMPFIKIFSLSDLFNGTAKLN